MVASYWKSHTWQCEPLKPNSKTLDILFIQLKNILIRRDQQKGKNITDLNHQPEQDGLSKLAFIYLENETTVNRNYITMVLTLSIHDNNSETGAAH